MDIGETVRIYEKKWFNQGKIIEIEDDCVIVDFVDWIHKFKKSELVLEIIFYEDVWVAKGGEIITDFR
jgi:hypothetical protein